MKNDSVKNKGFGTEALTQALQYAFEEIKMKTVYADVIHRNIRSQHVLEKIGFTEINQDDSFRYYEFDHSSWKSPEQAL